MKIFALNSSRDFGELVARHLYVPLSEHEEREFEDGEHKIRSLEEVQNQEIFVVHSLYSDNSQSVNDKLCRLLFFISSLKDAFAKKVTAVVPYLCYARKDRRTRPFDPLTNRYVARMVETAGADAIITMDVHNQQAFENAFSIPAVNLESGEIIAHYFATLPGNDNMVIMSPDFGGLKRAGQFVEKLNKLIGRDFPLVVMEKYRSGVIVTGEKISGDVRGKTVIIIDDLISTGTTISRAAAMCKKEGALKVIAFATHGLFTGRANEILAEPALDQILISNTIPPFRLSKTFLKEKVTILDVSQVFANEIRRIYEGGPVPELLEN